jgi:hypothetical protein
MAITGPSSYIPGINSFLPHWDAANATLSASGLGGELTVRISAQFDAVKRSDLVAWRDDLIASAAQLEDLILDRDLARTRNRILREEMHDRLNQFNRTARAVLIGTVYTKALPKVPPVSVGESRICLALYEMNTLWKTLNEAALAGEVPGLKGGLTLLGDYTQADFEKGIASLRTSYERTIEHEQHLKLARLRRDLIQENVYATLRGYRATVQAQFPPEDPLVLCLPRLSPTPGSTPDPVNAQGVWDATTDQAVLTWEASDHQNLAHYEVRYSPGESYDRDAETVQATIAPDAPREFPTRKGLVKAGDIALFKVYVVLTTGNECGSEVIRMKRAAAPTQPTASLPDRLLGETVPAESALSS